MRLRSVLVAFLMLGFLGETPPVFGLPGEAVDAQRTTRTTISLDVRGCNGCIVEAGQNNRRGSITYSTQRVVRNGHVTLRVPSRHTRRMFFAVYANWDELAPMAVVTGFRGRPAGSQVALSYARHRRHTSACWLGTSARQMSNTLIVRKVRIHYPIAGPGKYTVAAGYFTRTLRSQPAYYYAEKNAIHPTEADLCK